MRKPSRRLRAVQLELFHPRPETPSWPTLPPEIKRRTTMLLAQLFHEHLIDDVGPSGEEEATNE